MRGGAGQSVSCLAQHHDGGTGAGEPADEVPDLDDPGRVQGGQRLVEHQDVGAGHDGAGDGQPAQFSAGKGGGVPAQECGQPGQLRDAVDLPEHVRPGGAAVLEAKGELLGHRGAHSGEHGGRILRDVAHPARPGGRIDPGIVLAAAELQQLSRQPQGAGERSGLSGPEPAGQQLPQGGFAAAGSAQDGRQRAGTDADLDVPQRRISVPVEGEAADPGGQHGVPGRGDGTRCHGSPGCLGNPGYQGSAGCHGNPGAGQEAQSRSATAAAASTSSTARSRRWAGGSCTSR